MKESIKMLTNQYFSLLAFLFLLAGCAGNTNSGEEYTAYLFTYFTGNGPGEEAIRFALSEDGYNFKALNDNKAIIDSKKISTSGGVRDPHILRTADGKSFYMVVTDLYVPEMGWSNYAMVLMKSDDLINWTSSVVNIPETYKDEFGDVYRVWAPQTIYDENTGKYMIYFSMKQGEDPDKIYYAYANKDFTALESAPKQLYYPPVESNNKACIDGDIIYKDGKYHLFHKAEDGQPGIKLAISDSLTSGYKLVSNDRVDKEKDPVEGSGIFKLNNSDEWILMYDLYTKGGYQFTKSKDLKNFTVIDEDVKMNFHPRHGTVMPITQTELKRLLAKWATFDDPIITANSEKLKKINVYINGKKKKIHLPVKIGTDLSKFNPEFSAFTGFSITPAGAQDFSNGPVEYTISIDEKGSEKFEVTASEDHNPVLEGYYADPDILYSEKTGKYYIYPTTDGFMNWSGYYFKTFSSDDLINWKDEGTILDLKKDVSWISRNAWAPCIIEKKINGEYKYFYYFSAGQRIGVAVADNPTGPFVDKGEPLIDYKPEGVTGGQEIDPDVFEDPKTGKVYLYWGNGYMAGVELNDDMMSFDKSKIKLLKPDETYREGTYVIYRNGIYYFIWSEDDTRSPKYKLRYATSDSPLGEFTIPENNIIIQKDEEKEIFATGHNSVLQIPGTDEWYLVYHRFNFPKGIEMGDAGGFHREVCIDKMEFNEDGSIKEVMPTFKGIDGL
ncbi:family 43 glycosylhydrolase [Chondrinema litorale]|uniref:family 43 glycosylhydrolase n=1 Tax=Chondrinema litorale TaxID=2994555 RepID=UPI00254353D0|nr:family 43 glycosylhydrolase [Chondrinema litorale]UZR97597.1 family 43 glycosylhydrolase [Chondrinema litorale]